MFADDAYTWHAQGARRLLLGRPGEDRSRRARTPSPRRCTTPTLVIHGALDYRVPDQQGLAYYNTLKARGVDARLLWFPDENHWILKPRNSQALVRRVLRLAEGARPGREGRAAAPGTTRKRTAR